jgi:seryl-tRNA synthetase
LEEKLLNNMLNIKEIVNNPDYFIDNLSKRLKDSKKKIDQLIKTYKSKNKLQQKIDELRNELKTQSKNKPDKSEIEKLKNLSNTIKDEEEKLRTLEMELNEKLLEMPNITAEDVPDGGKEKNEVIETYGKKPELNFSNSDHIDLAEKHQLIDYERGVKIAKTGFWVYTGKGALLEWALLKYFIDFATEKGYELLLLPYLLNAESATASGHLPKFKEDLFWTEDQLCLNATGEMMLLNYHRNEILQELDLPLKYLTYSSLF